MNRVGVDILDVHRIKKAMEKNSRFKSRIYTEGELNHIEKKNSYRTAGGIFSSKEAVSKILGTGISGFSWKDIEIINDKRGKPNVALHNKAKELALNKGIEDIEVSISHSDNMVIAVAVATSKKLMLKNSSHISLPKRSKTSHKGDYGKVALIGGSEGMAGSIYLSSIASLRTGSGLVYTVVPRGISRILEIKSIENIVLAVEDEGRGYFNLLEKSLIKKLESMDVIAIGPGMGRKEATSQFLRDLLTHVDKPMVIDADGINNLSSFKEQLIGLKRKIIITPHAAELARFLDLAVAEINKDRESYAKHTANKYGITIVLKGNETLVTDGEKVYVNKSGNPGMATAGSGDVLTGVIASLLGQGYNLFEASKIGAYVHGLAGDMASQIVGEYGMIASDIVRSIPEAIKRLESREEL